MSRVANDDRTVSIQVFGKVQGVWFRASTLHKAQSLGLKGTVRNMPDGSVYIEAQGDVNSIDDFLDWCRSGPELARVDSVKVTDLATQRELQSPFSIERG